MVIYYSGTGNSRKLAQVLAAQLHDEAYDITADLREKQFPAFQNKAAAYVFVCPAYAYRIPRIFENYLRQARFEGGKNAYFVLSCGSNIGNAMHHTKTVCRQIGLHFQGIAAVKMPENYICMFDSPPQDTARKLVQAGEETVKQLADTIRAGKPLPAVRGSSFLTYVVNRCFTSSLSMTKSFMQQTPAPAADCAQRSAHSKTSLWKTGGQAGTATVRSARHASASARTQRSNTAR